MNQVFTLAQSTLRNLLSLTVAVLLLMLLASPAFAREGQTVGVGSYIGEIRTDTALKRGAVTEIPTPFNFSNTGTIESEYRMEVSYIEGQEELKPAQEWFRFEPRVYSLRPGQAINIELELDIPRDAEPGDYFAVVESRLVKDGNIGLGTGTKFYFTVSNSTAPIEAPGGDVEGDVPTPLERLSGLEFNWLAAILLSVTVFFASTTILLLLGRRSGSK